MTISSEIGGSRIPAFWREVGRQLRHPRGARGWLVGRAMALVNRKPNALGVEALQIGPRDVVLELGCGPGRALRRLAGHAAGGRVVGLDQSVEMLAQAGRYNRYAMRDGRIELCRCGFTPLPFADGAFDKILAVNVAYFFHADGRELREARRVLRVGGQMAIYVSDEETMSRWPFVGAETHATFDTNSLARLLRRGGFGLDEVSVTTVSLPLGINGYVATLRKQRA